MSTDPDVIRERAWVEHRHPDLTTIEESMWVAEDPVTDCAGVGAVEAEAVGNLVAVVVECETETDVDCPRLKLPGRAVPRPSAQAESSGSVVDFIRSLF